MPNQPDFRVLSFQPKQGGLLTSARKYQRRKTHKKTKTGCLGCKAKRVKCDEARPSCSRCRRNSTWCSYIVDDSSDSASNAEEETTLGSGRSVIHLGSLESSSAIHGFDANEGLTPRGTPRIVLMQHFQYLFPDLNMLKPANVNPILSLGLCRPFLLDSILAVSASHLRCQSVSKTSHRVAEHFQQALAIRNFQGALGRVLDQQTADALLLTAMFLNLLSFSAVEDEHVGSSWVYSDDAEGLGWLSLSLGIKPLIYATETFRDGTILDWIFEASDDESKAIHGVSESMHLRNVPAHWLDLFSLTRDSNSDDIFFDTLRILSETSRLEPCPNHFFLYVNMIGSLDFDIRTRLERKDDAAMWLIGYWLGLLCRYDFWWLKKRARRDYHAICTKLRESGVRNRPGAEGVMWRKLTDDLEMAPRWGGIQEWELSL